MMKHRIMLNVCKDADASHSIKETVTQVSLCLQNKLPVTVLCPSVRLLQKSSTIDISRMSCRWKLDSWFHQSCQCTMSWDPW